MAALIKFIGLAFIVVIIAVGGYRLLETAFNGIRVTFFNPKQSPVNPKVKPKKSSSKARKKSKKK